MVGCVAKPALSRFRNTPTIARFVERSVRPATPLLASLELNGDVGIMLPAGTGRVTR